MSTVDEAIAQARTRGLERLDAQLLLAHVTGQGRAWQIAHGDSPLSEEQSARMQALVDRRSGGEPLAYLVGEKEFHGLPLAVDRRVLVPRPDTEVLVDWALECLRDGPPNATAVDLGTGSGAIALAVKAARPTTAVLATDASSEALAVAHANAERLDLAVEFAAGSWWQAVGTRRFSLAMSNPPYIAGTDSHLAALRHEPQSALTPGPTGLEALAAIVADAPAHLLSGAWLLLEHGFDQGDDVQALLAARGFHGICTRRDLAGLPRCTGGRLS